MVKERKQACPRKIGGGRSARYAERREERGVTSAYAEEWSDAAAAAVQEGMKAGKNKAGVILLSYAETALASEESVRAFMRDECPRLSPGDRALAERIMLVHSGRMQEAVGEARAKRARAFLKPLRARGSARPPPKALELVAARAGPASFLDWLADQPKKERLRDITKSKRTFDGIKKWPLTWLRGRGAVCYERAHGRIRRERGGKPDAEFLKGVVKTHVLPTAVASESDHYVIVDPERPPRFMTVEEVARGFGIPAESPLMEMLAREKPLTPNQAVACLGRSVHVCSATRIVETLVARGHIGPGLTYGSAYSGIDTFAAAVEKATGGDWSYTFASELEESTRNGLLAAWGVRGLTFMSCHYNALSEAARTSPQVDLFVITASCEPHSRRNHSPSHADQRASLEDVWAGLGYVREARPRVVVMENVNEASSAGPLTGLLARLEGYTMEAGVLDPEADGSAPMARERHFWVLTRDGE